MNSVIISVLAFIVAIGVLVTVHEFGHFWVARRLGIKVLKFSIGFGKPLWKWEIGKDRMELVIAALPLGGFVKMLDESEGDVPASEVHRAFNRKPVATRIAVVVAGPVFNFLFAIFAYWVVLVSGVTGIRPVIGEVLPATYAAEAGFEKGDEIIAIGNQETPTWERVSLGILDSVLETGSRQLFRVRHASGSTRDLQVHFNRPDDMLAGGRVIENFGLVPARQVLPAIIDRVIADSPAQQAGLVAGDRIMVADGVMIDDWYAWVTYVRQRPDIRIQIDVERAGQRISLELTPAMTDVKGEKVGRIGAYVRLPDENQHDTMRVVVKYGFAEAVPRALSRTWEMTQLTLRALWKMVIGQTSIENLSGPISIAKYAGQTATIGLAAFFGFLAIVSVSLGVLNLLPIPVLDGGHLLYYLIELVKGSPLSDAAQMAGQRLGIFMLLALMLFAIYNDLVRIIE